MSSVEREEGVCLERDSVVMSSTWLGNNSEEEGEVVRENKELDGVGSMVWVRVQLED